MKSSTFLFLLVLSILSFSSFCQNRKSEAQNFKKINSKAADASSEKATVFLETLKGFQTFNFYDALRDGVPYYASQTQDGKVCDLGFLKDFNNGATSVQVILRANHPRVGRFILKTPNSESDDPYTCEIEIDYNINSSNKRFIYAATVNDKSTGNLTITKYGKVGEYIEGAFEATLPVLDVNTQQSLDTKKVSGTFKIQRTEDRD